MKEEIMMSCDNCSGGYREDEELYVYDQCCENCRYYCDWEDERQKGCRYYARDDYERMPETHWCYQWRGKKGRHGRYGDS